MYETYILRGMRHQQASEAGQHDGSGEGSGGGMGMPPASEQGQAAAAERGGADVACPLLSKHVPLAFRATSVLCLGISVRIVCLLAPRPRPKYPVPSPPRPCDCPSPP